MSSKSPKSICVDEHTRRGVNTSKNIQGQPQLEALIGAVLKGQTIKKLNEIKSCAHLIMIYT